MNGIPTALTAAESLEKIYDLSAQRFESPFHQNLQDPKANNVHDLRVPRHEACALSLLRTGYCPLFFLKVYKEKGVFEI